MTAVAKKTEIKTSDALTRCPGPNLVGTVYELIQTRSQLTRTVAIGNVVNNGLSMEGRIETIANIGEGVVRVVARSGTTVFYIDFWGDYQGSVKVDGIELWHTPKLVSREVTEARKALDALSMEDRTELLDGLPKPAA